jgi:hypothetical protein
MGERLWKFHMNCHSATVPMNHEYVGLTFRTRNPEPIF